MAVKRINMMDVLASNAAKVARSRTAVLRRGTVSVAPDPTTGLAKVSLGGGTVDAVALKTGPLAAGDQVAVIADTDAYWIAGVIGAATALQKTSESDFGSSSSGYTRSGTTGVKIALASGGNLVQLAFTFTNPTAITVPATGLLSVIVISALPLEFIPAVNKSFVTVESQAGAIGSDYWQVRTDGVVQWIGATAGMSLPAGSTRTAQLLYLV
jgi:hypothetical protein